MNGRLFRFNPFPLGEIESIKQNHIMLGYCSDLLDSSFDTTTKKQQKYFLCVSFENDFRIDTQN